MGNICRSPAAEAIFRQYVEQEGWETEIICRSAGTLGEHAGEKPDPRMCKAALSRGYSLESRARKFSREDFDKYDLILALDRDIHRTLKSIAASPEHTAKIALLGGYHPDEIVDVPDPYYGHSAGFDQVLEMLEYACRGLLDDIASRHNLR